MYASAAAWGIAGRSDCGGSDSGRASGPGGTRASRAFPSRIDATSGGGAEGSSAGATVGPAEEAPFRSLALLSAGRLFFARGSSGAGLRAFAMVVLGTAADSGLFEESLSEHTGTPGAVESPHYRPAVRRPAGLLSPRELSARLAGQDHDRVFRPTACDP